jgi:hypothetical protein
MPWALTRIVAPSVEFDAVFTTNADPAPLGCDAGAALDADELLELLLELLPQAASSRDAASEGTRYFVI